MHRIVNPQNCSWYIPKLLCMFSLCFFVTVPWIDATWSCASLLIGEQNKTWFDCNRYRQNATHRSAKPQIWIWSFLHHKPRGFQPLAPLKCHVSRIAASSITTQAATCNEIICRPYLGKLIGKPCHASSHDWSNLPKMSDNPLGTWRTILLRKMPKGNHAYSEQGACLQCKLLTWKQLTTAPAAAWDQAPECYLAYTRRGAAVCPANSG